MKKRFSYLLATVLLTVVPCLQAADEAALKRAQAQLQILELYEGPLDGLSGPGTERALRRFQIRNGLEPTGKVDEETRAMLNQQVPSADVARPPPEPTPTPAPTPSGLEPGVVESDRQFLQQRRPSPTPTPAVQRRAPAPDPGPPPAMRAARLPLSDVFQGSPYEYAAPEVQEFVLRDAQRRLRSMRFYHARTDGRDRPALRQALLSFQHAFRLQQTGRLDRATLFSLGMLPSSSGAHFEQREFQGMEGLVNLFLRDTERGHQGDGVPYGAG